MTKDHIFAFLAGLLFGLGLILSGMTNPAKVLSFLDISALWNPVWVVVANHGEKSGAPLLWDPSLAFVMLGAIAVAAIAFAIAKKRSTSLIGTAMHLPTSRALDKRLVFGSLIFGVGWGLAGICPGPSIVLLGTGNLKGLIFVLAMLAGMAVFELFESRRLKQPK